jgi:hypothetical protein
MQHPLMTSYALMRPSYAPSMMSYAPMRPSYAPLMMSMTSDIMVFIQNLGNHRIFERDDPTGVDSSHAGRVRHTLLVHGCEHRDIISPARFTQTWYVLVCNNLEFNNTINWLYKALFMN